MLNPKSAYQQSAPLQYKNEINILKKSGEYLSYWGRKILISGGEKALKSSIDEIIKSLESEDLEWKIHTFIGECCDSNINEITRKAKKFGADIIIGIGGGKSIDSAKVAANKAKCSMVAIPTIAATCSASSSFSIVYTSNNLFKRRHYLPSHPELVLIDPNIIAEAPVKYLKSGIIDGLSKWYEGRAVFDGLENPDLFSQSAICLARLLKERMINQSILAIEACNNNIVNQSLLEIIDLNIYITGLIQSLGQITCCGAAAHAIHNGMTVMKDSHNILHGMKIAYGIIVQLFLENKSIKEIKEVINFFKELDVTPSLKGLGLSSNPHILKKIGERTITDELISRMPNKIELNDLLVAMKKVESFV